MKPRDPEKEQAFLDAALDVIDRDGLEALTIQKVAQHTGLSVGAVYVYFDSKEDLLRRLYRQTKARALTLVLEGYTPELPFRQAVRLLCRNQMTLLIEQRRESRFQRQFFRAGLTDRETEAAARASLAPLVELVKRGQREDLVKPWEPDVVLRFMLAVLRDAAEAARDTDPERRRLLIDQATEFCLAGIAP